MFSQAPALLYSRAAAEGFPPPLRVGGCLRHLSFHGCAPFMRTHVLTCVPVWAFGAPEPGWAHRQPRLLCGGVLSCARFSRWLSSAPSLFAVLPPMGVRRSWFVGGFLGTLPTRDAAVVRLTFTFLLLRRVADVLELGARVGAPAFVLMTECGGVLPCALYLDGCFSSISTSHGS